MVIGKRISWFILIVLIVTSFASFAAAEVSDCLYYFYGEGCQDCKTVESYLIKLQEKYPSLQIEKYEVYFHKENSRLLKRYFIGYNVPEDARGVPAIFLTQSYFTTPESITDFLEERIIDNTDSSCPSVDIPASIGVVGENEPENILKTLTFSRTTGNAIIHASSGGMIALVLLLIIFLVMLRNTQDLAKRGFIFIGGVALAYFLYALGLFSWFAVLPWTNLFYKVVGLLAIIIGALKLRGFFNSWEELFGSLGETSQKRIILLRLYLTSPVTFFVIGFVGGLLTLGKTSNVLFALRGMMLGNFQAGAFPLLIYYLFVLLLPQILIVLILFRVMTNIEKHAQKKAEEGFSDLEADRKRAFWRKYNFKLLNFVVSWVLIVMGVLVLFL